jgi:hypothetical protein
MIFQSRFMSTTRAMVGSRQIKRDIEAAEMRVTVVGIFAFSVSMMGDHAEPEACRSVADCSISRSPSELPKAAIGRRPMYSLIPTGLPSLSSIKFDGGEAEYRWYAIAHDECGLDR